MPTNNILNRTVFYDMTGGVVRFRDYAHVTTTLGGMVEPFNVNQRKEPDTDMVDFDPTDDMCRIDQMQAIDATMEGQLLSFGATGQPLHEFSQPRTGK